MLDTQVKKLSFQMFSMSSTTLIVSLIIMFLFTSKTLFEWWFDEYQVRPTKYLLILINHTLAFVYGIMIYQDLAKIKSYDFD